MCGGGGVTQIWNWYIFTAHCLKMGGLRSGPSLKIRGGGVLSERPLTGKTGDLGVKNNKETYVFFLNDGLFDLPRSEKQNKELFFVLFVLCSLFVLLLWFIFICYHIYNVCLLHDIVATLRLSALPFALYFILSKLALWPLHFNSCSPCFPQE